MVLAGRRLVLVAALVLIWAGAASAGWAQTTQVDAAGKLEFDVASVKQNKSNVPQRSNFSLDNGNVYSTVERGAVFGPNGGYFSAVNQPLWRYISFAYDLSGTQELAMRFSYFTGLTSKVPEWVTGGFESSAERFDIEARAAGTPTKNQMRAMMRSLLEERFKLAAHLETREAPVFALVLVKPEKLGPRLRPHPEDGSCAAAGSDDEAAKKTVTADGYPTACGVIAHLPPGGPGRSSFGGRDVPLALFATSLPTQTGMATVSRPVIDRTGLSGKFDLSLEWVGEYNPPPDASGPTFAEAMKEQLGLKLEAAKGPIEVLVIDHVEQPSLN
jgi:uncharacterized protein (TIGR03435 family)